MYVLFQSYSDKAFGAFKTISEMKEAVDRLIDEGLNVTLAYHEYKNLPCSVPINWENNDGPIPDGWDWVFIAKDSDVSFLGQGGGWVPPKEFWGLNLLDEKIGKEVFEIYCKED